jgi:hypothetical protein
MTTIAVRGFVMACDSRLVVDGHYYRCDDKVLLFGDSLMGGAGDWGEVAQFRAWFKDKGDMPKLEDFEVLVLNRAGLWHYCNDCYPTRIVGGCYAIGSGGQAAHAAMLCGKTPEEAIRIAMKCDINTGGPVRVYNLKGE